MDLVFIPDLLEAYPGRYMAIRNENLNPKTYDAAYYKEGVSWYRKSYSLGQIARTKSQEYFLSILAKIFQRNDGVFCSQLVVAIYDRIDLNLSIGKPVNRVLPTDLYKLNRRNDWKDVTSIYKEVAPYLSTAECREWFGYTKKALISQFDSSARSIQDYHLAKAILDAYDCIFETYGVPQKAAPISYDAGTIKFHVLDYPDRNKR